MSAAAVSAAFDAGNAQLLALFALEDRLAGEGVFVTAGDRIGADAVVLVKGRPDIAWLRGARALAAYVAFPAGFVRGLPAPLVNAAVDAVVPFLREGDADRPVAAVFARLPSDLQAALRALQEAETRVAESVVAGLAPFRATLDRVTGVEPAVGQQELAQALIATGQLTLGPEAFTSPEAQTALANALTPIALPRPMPLGGSMSAPWFGLGGSFLGGTTPSNPFGPVGFLPIPPPPEGTMMPFPGTAGGIFGTLLNVGSQFFLQQQAAKQQEELFKRQLQVLQAQQMLGLGFGATAGGGIVVNPDGTIGVAGMAGMGPGLNAVPGLPSMPWQLPGGVGAACGSRGAVSVSPMDSPGIYRTGCGPCGTQQLITRNRFFALRSDGTKDLFVKVGKVQSVSPRTLTRFARRWAKEARLSIGARGRPRRGYRRPR